MSQFIIPDFIKNADLFMKENLKIIYLLMIDIKI